MSDELLDMVGVDGDNRPTVYREDDDGGGGYVWVMRASGFAGCETRLARTAAEVPGEPTPDWLQDAFDFGSEHEAEVISRLEDTGEWRVLRGEELDQYGRVDASGQLALEVKLGKGVVRCHPDGIVERVSDGELFVLEVKTAAKSNDPERGHYDWQFAIEHSVTGLPVLLVVGWKEKDKKGNVSLVDGAPEVRVLAGKAIKYTTGQIKARIARLVKVFEQAREEGGWEAPCDKQDYPCPYVALCGSEHKEARAAKKETESVRIEDAEIVARIKTHSEAIERHTTNKKIAEACLKEAKAALQEIVGEGKFTAGEWYVSVSVADMEETVTTRKAHKRTTVKVERRTVQDQIDTGDK